MERNFKETINDAKKRCMGLFVNNILEEGDFCRIYPFTTENIAGYVKEFDLKGKSLLTVGSSGDQAINAILYGCQDITILDINSYTKFYYYLKVACILSLNIHEFMNFLRYKNYPDIWNVNKVYLFNKNLFKKIKSSLASLDYESYLFWDELINNFDPLDIRLNLFFTDEGRNNSIINSNPYLKNNDSYEMVRNKIKNSSPIFIHNDLFKANLVRNYDNIWLSNIGTLLTQERLKLMIDIMAQHLNKDGMMLISYLYDTTIDSQYKTTWKKIYDLETTFQNLKDYNPDLLSFTGIQGFISNESNIKDSVLIYRKH